MQNINKFAAGQTRARYYYNHRNRFHTKGTH